MYMCKPQETHTHTHMHTHTYRQDSCREHLSRGNRYNLEKVLTNKYLLPSTSRMVIFSMLLLSSRAISSVTMGNTVDISLPRLAKTTFKIFPESGGEGGSEGSEQTEGGKDEARYCYSIQHSLSFITLSHSPSFFLLSSFILYADLSIFLAPCLPSIPASFLFLTTLECLHLPPCS